MPSNVVETKEDEKKWEKAKKKAEEQGKGDNYKLIMSIYKKMNPDGIDSSDGDSSKEKESAADFLRKMGEEGTDAENVPEENEEEIPDEDEEENEEYEEGTEVEVDVETKEASMGDVAQKIVQRANTKSRQKSASLDTSSEYEFAQKLRKLARDIRQNGIKGASKDHGTSIQELRSYVNALR